MDELVYASDIDTNEVVYMNRKARETYGVKSIEELKGKKCYEVLQGLDSPCQVCNNHKLKPGYFEEWRYYNPKLDKKFALKDTLVEADGRRIRVELAVDMSEEEEQKETIETFINSEAIINEGLRRALSTDVPDDAITLFLDYIGNALKCERAYIFEEVSEGFYDNTYEWCAPGVHSEKDELQKVPFDAVKMWFDRFQDGKNVIIQNLEDWKEKDPVAYDYLQPQNIHSLVVCPLMFNNRIFGFYGVDNPPVGHLERISSLFQIMAHFMASVLRRRDLIRRLEEMSYYDQLTGFKNRHGMEAFVNSMNPEESIGIAYCDVTGLKWINDHYGHQVGDQLLLRATGCIRDAFPEDAWFRMGGDEFLVLCPGITREALQEREAGLREILKTRDVHLAVGFVWRPDSKENMDKLLIEADELMYDDKRKYYAEKMRVD
jgi:diguanylate cyclase (GGDEF)-like protein